jgi:hypothetical protein
MVLRPRIHQQQVPCLYTTHRLNVVDGVGIIACTRKKNHSSSSLSISGTLSPHLLAGGPPPPSTHRLNVVDGVDIIASTREQNHSSSSFSISGTLSLPPSAGDSPSPYHPQTQCIGWCWHYCLHKKAESFQQFLEYPWYSVPTSISRRSPTSTPPTDSM